MELSTEDRAVLAHVLPDPDAWVANALTRLGEDVGTQAITDKIAKYRQAYLDALATEGEAYQTRAERDEATQEGESALTNEQHVTTLQRTTHDLASRRELLELCERAKTLTEIRTAFVALATHVLGGTP